MVDTFGGVTCEPPQYESLPINPGLQPGELKGFIKVPCRREIKIRTDTDKE